MAERAHRLLIVWEPRARTPRPWFFRSFLRDPRNRWHFFACWGFGTLLIRICNPPVAH